MTGVIVGLSRGDAQVLQAEHWLHELVRPLGLPGPIACTHLVQTPYPHVAVSVDGPLPATSAPELAEAAEQAAAAHRARTGGRAVRYPGVDELVGSLTVAWVLNLSAIERVIVLGGGEPSPDTVLHTRDFVRPQWMDGVLTLVATRVAGGGIAPFEVPNPTPCCADH
jgi:hypothetical protein